MRSFWALSTAARAVSAAKEMALAAAFGTSLWKDALVVAWTAPTLASSYCTETLPPLLTPLWAQRRSGRLLRRLLAALIVLPLAMSAAAFAWPRHLVLWIAPGLPPATLAAAIRLERLLAVNIALLGGQAMATAWCNARRRFLRNPSGAMLTGLSVLAAVAVSRGWPPERRMTWVAWAMTAGNVLALAAMIAPMWRKATSMEAGKAVPSNVDPGRAAWRAMPVLLLAMLIVNLVPIADRIAASSLPSGSLAAFDYGQRLVQLVFTLGVVPYTTLSFTRLSELGANTAEEAVAGEVERGLRRLLAGVAPIAVGTAVFAPWITRYIYGWGRFDAHSLALTTPVVAIKGASLVLDAAFYYLVYAVYARRHPEAKLGFALVLCAVNVPLDFLLAPRLGVAGLAWAHMAAWAAGLGWIALRRRQYLPGLKWRHPLQRCLVPGAAALVAALAARAVLASVLPL